MTTKHPAAIQRMSIVIKGVVDRTISAVDTMVEELHNNGVSDDVILARVEQEIAGGKVLAEMRNFASAKIPGFVGDMAYRFGRDTASAFAQTDKADIQKALDEMAAGNGAVTDAIDAPTMEPPPDAPLDELYIWVAMDDKNTCDVCEGNNGEINTLGDWADIGEPRSGACAGSESCRCILVAIGNLSDEDMQAIKDGKV